MTDTKSIKNLDLKVSEYDETIRKLEDEKKKQAELRDKILEEKNNLFASGIFDKAENFLKNCVRLESQYDELVEDVSELSKSDPHFFKFAEKQKRPGIFTIIAETFLKPGRNAFFEDFLREVARADCGKNEQSYFGLKGR